MSATLTHDPVPGGPRAAVARFLTQYPTRSRAEALHLALQSLRDRVEPDRVLACTLAWETLPWRGGTVMPWDQRIESFLNRYPALRAIGNTPLTPVSTPRTLGCGRDGLDICQRSLSSFVASLLRGGRSRLELVERDDCSCPGRADGRCRLCSAL
jgi:hypothetical protein